MDPTDQLALAHRNFATVLDGVADSALDASTPCAGWSVEDLVWHLIEGERMAVALLAGASRDEAVACFNSDREGIGPRAALEAACAAGETAFRCDGALEAVVHHPIGDVPGAMMLNFRIGDFTVHTWDLAHSVGQDVTLDSTLVETVYGQLEPLSAMIPSLGIFGEGPSGTLGEEAPMQLRLLDLTGRRP